MNDETTQARDKARATYDAAADSFDAPPLAFWSRIGARTVERLDLKSGETVLDIGCGNGASAIPAAEAVGPSGRVVGVDLSARLLEQGCAKAKAAGLGNVEFREADMTALGYSDGEFDAVISVFSIFFVPDMEGLVTELWRMVRPGGRLAVTTWGPDIFEPAYSHWLETLKRERPDLHSAFNPWDRITDTGAVRQLFLDGGAAEPDVIAEESAQPLRGAEDWWTIALGSGLRWSIDAMDAATRDRVKTDNLEWIANNGVADLATNAIYAVARK
jgi:ubiquinone/menaquinone biosynthesis C-methylase UbiE